MQPTSDPGTGPNSYNEGQPPPLPQVTQGGYVIPQNQAFLGRQQNVLRTPPSATGRPEDYHISTVQASPYCQYGTNTQASRSFGPPSQPIPTTPTPGSFPYEPATQLSYSQADQTHPAGNTPEIYLERKGTNHAITSPTYTTLVRTGCLRTPATSSGTSSPGLLSHSPFSQGNSSPGIHSPSYEGGYSPSLGSPITSGRSTFPSMKRRGSRGSGRRKKVPTEQDDEENDFPEDDEVGDYTAKTKRLRTDNTKDSPPALACPCFQHDAWLGRSACSGPGFADFGRVKEHILRAHSAEVYCDCCKKVFNVKNRDELLEKHRTQGGCQPSDSLPDHILPGDKIEQIKNIKDRKMNDKDKWECVYKIVYPSDDVRWAYNDSISFDTVRNNVARLYRDEIQHDQRLVVGRQIDPGTIGLLISKLNAVFETCGQQEKLCIRKSSESNFHLPSLPAQQNMMFQQQNDTSTLQDPFNTGFPQPPPNAPTSAGTDHMYLPSLDNSRNFN